jgi:hypothetical protein
MKRFVGILLFAVVFFMSGCEQEQQIECDEGYYIFVESCYRIPELEDSDSYLLSTWLVEDAYHYMSYTFRDYCVDYGVNQYSCYDFNTEVEELEPPFSIYSSSFHVEYLEDHKFKLLVFYSEEDKVLTLSGQLTFNESYEIEIKDFEYSIESNYPVTEEEVEMVFLELILNKNESIFCDVHNLKSNYIIKDCNEFRDSKILVQLDEVRDVSIGDNGNATISLMNSELEQVAASITMNIHKYDEEYYMEYIRYEDTTSKYITSEQIKDYYEKMFTGGFTEQNILEFCQQPLKNEEDNEYAIDISRCNYSTSNLSDTELSIEVFPFDNSPEVFNVFISEVNGDSALVFMNNNYISEEYIQQSKINVIATEAISIYGAQRLMVEFLDEYLLNPEQACTDFFKDAYDCTEFTIDEDLVSIDSLLVAWPDGGLYGISFDVAITDNISDDTYDFSVVIEKVNDELTIIEYYTGNYFDLTYGADN